MMMNAPYVRLEQVLQGRTLSYGIVQPGFDVGLNGTPIIRVKDLRVGQISAVSPMRVATEIAERHKRTTLLGGELLVSVVGSVGETGLVGPELIGWNVARAIAVLRPDGVEARWLQLCFQSPQVRNQISAALNTTVQATLNLSDAKQIKLPLPEGRVRRPIISLFRALDEKIETNDQIIKQIESLASAAFESVVDKSLEISPAKLAKFVNGKAFTKDASGIGRVVVRIAELNSGVGPSTVRTDLAVADQYIARPGDLLFAWSGSLTVNRWFRDEAIINQHIFKVIPYGDTPIWLVYQILMQKLADFRDIAKNKATTIGHIQRHHLEAPAFMPSSENIAQISDLMGALWRRALAAERETLKLTALRDTLLPELMSGRLRVRDAEEQVGEVL